MAVTVNRDRHKKPPGKTVSARSGSSSESCSSGREKDGRQRRRKGDRGVDIDLTNGESEGTDTPTNSRFSTTSPPPPTTTKNRTAKPLPFRKQTPACQQKELTRPTYEPNFILIESSDNESDHETHEEDDNTTMNMHNADRNNGNSSTSTGTDRHEKANVSVPAETMTGQRFKRQKLSSRTPMLKPTTRAASARPSTSRPTSDTRHLPHSSRPNGGQAQAYRYAHTFLPSKGPRFCNEKNYSYNMSTEEAMREQDRLLQQSADRMKNEQRKRAAGFPLTSFRSRVVRGSPTFTRPVPLDKLNMNHWQWTCPFSRLGLPRSSNAITIKKQYRMLALAYHPDKCKDELATRKFQAVTEAYKKVSAT